MEYVIILLVMLLLLLLKGFFSGSEIALVNSDKLKLHHKANQGNRCPFCQSDRVVIRREESPSTPT